MACWALMSHAFLSIHWAFSSLCPCGLDLVSSDSFRSSFLLSAGSRFAGGSGVNCVSSHLGHVWCAVAPLLTRDLEPSRPPSQFHLLSSDGPQFSSVQFIPSVVSHSLRPHEPQHIRPPCLSPTPGVHPNSCPSSR